MKKIIQTLIGVIFALGSYQNIFCQQHPQQKKTMYAFFISHFNYDIDDYEAKRVCISNVFQVKSNEVTHNDWATYDKVLGRSIEDAVHDFCRSYIDGTFDMYSHFPPSIHVYETEQEANKKRTNSLGSYDRDWHILVLQNYYLYYSGTWSSHNWQWLNGSPKRINEEEIINEEISSKKQDKPSGGYYWTCQATGRKYWISSDWQIHQSMLSKAQKECEEEATRLVNEQILIGGVEALASHIGQQRRKDYEKRGLAFWDYTVSFPVSGIPIGFSIGMINPRSVSWYIAGRTDYDYLLSEVSDSASKYELPTGKIKEVGLDLTAGLTKNIVFPLAMYLGGGMSNNMQYEIYKDPDPLPGDSGKRKVLVPDSKKWEPIIETGIYLYGSGLILSAGVRSNIKFNSIYFTLGIGLSATL